MAAYSLRFFAACGGSTDSVSECATEQIGQLNCHCRPDRACSEGLVCNADTRQCEAPRSQGLPDIDPVARSCEVLLDDDGAAVAGVRFADTLRGELERQAPQTALAFLSKADAPFAGSSVQIELLGKGSFRISHAQCFDRDGKAISGGGIAAP